MNKIIVGITTYNPSIDLLIENIESIQKQVNEIVIVDNFSVNVSEVEKISVKYKIKLIKNNTNKGIGYALNQILDYSIKHNYNWYLTLDQDTVCNDNLIQTYVKYLSEDVGQLTCIIQDRKYGIKYGSDAKTNTEYEIVDDCITSGSLNNTKAIQSIGGYDSSLFIDGIDLDLSYNLQKHGYLIKRINFVGVIHSEGNVITKNIFGSKVKLMNHEPLRNYYARRNVIYISRKYLKGIDKFKSIGKQIYYGLGTILFEDRKTERIKYNIKGIFEGITKKV